MISIRQFFSDLNNDNVDGVAFKNRQLKKDILSYFATSADASIAELSKHFNVSTPKITELLVDLIDNGLVKDQGKGENGIGRRPNIYGLNEKSIYFIGVDVKKDYVNIGLLDFKKTLIKTANRIPFPFDDTPDSLDKLCDIIQKFVGGLSAIADQIVGIGVNLSGRINYKTGHSYSFFHFSEEPLSQVIESKLHIPTYLENDSRAMAYGEFSSGLVTTEKNVLYINVDYGIGMGTMINGQLYYGKSGFAGEFGHIRIFHNEILCQCGKKGCLETEASGQALVQLFTKKLEAGANSIISKKYADKSQIRLSDIIEAALNEDMLSIESISTIGEKLGQGIATLINLYNPELVIIGGTLSQTGDYLYLPIKSAVNKYSLSMVSNDTEIKVSTLGEQAGVIGACLLVRNRLLSMS